MASRGSCCCCCPSCFAAEGVCGNGADEPQELTLLLRLLSIREPSAAACSQERMSCLFTFTRAKTHNSANEVAGLENEFETIWGDNASGAPKRRNAFWTVSTARQNSAGGRRGAAGAPPPEQERLAEATATALPVSQNMPLPGTGAVALPRKFQASLRGGTRGRKRSRGITRFDANLPSLGVIAASAAEPAWPREYNANTSRGVSRGAWPEGRQRDGLTSLRWCDCLGCRQQVPTAESSTCFWPRSPRFPVTRPPPPALERLPGDWKRRCWCCDGYGQKYSQCTKPFGLRRRCFGCGLPDHTKKTCPNCSPNYQAEVIRFVSLTK